MVQYVVETDRYYSSNYYGTQPNKIMAPHKENIIERAQQFKRVLVLQDTIELNYSGLNEKQGVGPKKYKDERNLFLHPQLVISESGVCLGVYDDYQ